MTTPTPAGVDNRAAERRVSELQEVNKNLVNEVNDLRELVETL